MFCGEILGVIRLKRSFGVGVALCNFERDTISGRFGRFEVRGRERRKRNGRTGCGFREIDDWSYH